MFLCRKLSGGGVGTGGLDGARRGRKLGFILHYHNRITVANKASISAPTVAFGEDPSLFSSAGRPSLFKENLPFVPPFMSLAGLQQGAQRTHTHTHRAAQTHAACWSHIRVCVCNARLHVCTHGWPVPQRSAGSLTCPSEGITST